MKKITKRSFFLLEILIGLSLLLAASGLFALKWHESIEARRFDTSVEAFRDACQVAHRLAVATQTDWQGTLKRGAAGWVFEVVCLEGNRPGRLKTTCLGDLLIANERAGLPNSWSLLFFSSGTISPSGVLTFSRKQRKKQVAIAEIAGLYENETLKQGPLHPLDLTKNRKAAVF